MLAVNNYLNLKKKIRDMCGVSYSGERELKEGEEKIVNFFLY